MRRAWALLLLLGPALAQEPVLLTSGDALDASVCEQVAREVMAGLEAYTRMKFRRPVPVGVLPKREWDAMIQQEGFAGEAARHGLAFYDPGENSVTVSPWVMGGYVLPEPILKAKEEWVADLESTIIHELMHALHHQNFHVVLGGAREASMRVHGLSEEEIDAATVEFVTAEGTAELVSVRVASDRARQNLVYRPNPQIPSAEGYLLKYRPNGKDPFITTLFASGYQDGLDVMHQLSLKAGARGVRAVLYRPPPAVLFFQPERLAALHLDDPPDPDSIFGYLSPDRPTGLEVYLAVNPGNRRFFSEARHTPGGPRAEGCLLGFVTTVGDVSAPDGRGSYAFWVGDPDHKGTWSADQVASLKETNPAGVAEKRVPMSPLVSKEERIDLLSVKSGDGSLYVRGECKGLVVLAHESRPTPNLERRVVDAVAALFIKRPTPAIYTKAAAEARAKLGGR